MPRRSDTTRYSNIDFDDCGECAEESGSGICSNCEADGAYCPVCHSTGDCQTCEGTGRRPYKPSAEQIAEIEAAGPLINPDDVSDP